MPQYLIKLLKRVVGLCAKKYNVSLRRNHNCQTLQLSFKFVDEKFYWCTVGVIDVITHDTLCDVDTERTEIKS